MATMSSGRRNRHDSSPGKSYRGSHRGGWQGQQRNVRRIAVRALLGAGIAWLSFAVTVDRVFGTRAPATAARWGAGAASTDAARANNLAQAGASPAALAQAERLARRALAASPVSVLAVRALADAAALRGDIPRADRLFAYSETLSRRDLLTQMWLIEERVRQGDVAGALTHYDRALRTVGRARGILFPVLVPAASRPDVAGALAPLLARRVAWGPDYLAVMAEAPDASPDALGRLLLAARLRPEVAAERGPLGAAVGRLVASGRYSTAYAAYRQAVGEKGAGVLLRDGGFEADPVLPPFDWSFADETDLSATRERGGNGTALVLRATNGRSGELARQLLLLRPGGYRLGLSASGAQADRLSRAAVAVTCLSSGGELLRLPVSAITRARLTGTFGVPAGCAAQMLTIVAPAGLGDSDSGVMVDDLTIVPVGG